MNLKSKKESNQSNKLCFLTLAALLILFASAHAQTENSIDTMADSLGIQVDGSNQDITVKILALTDGQGLIFKSTGHHFSVKKETGKGKIAIFLLTKMDQDYAYGYQLDCSESELSPTYFNRNHGFVTEGHGFSFLKFACFDGEKPKVIMEEVKLPTEMFLASKEKILEESKKEFEFSGNTIDAFRTLLYQENEIPEGESNLKKALEWADKKWKNNTKPEYPELFFSTIQKGRYERQLFVLQLNKNAKSGEITVKAFMMFDNWPSLTWDLAGTVTFTDIEFIKKDAVIEKLKKYAIQSTNAPTEPGKGKQTMDAIADNLEFNKKEFYDHFNVPKFEINILQTDRPVIKAGNGKTIILPEQYSFTIAIKGIKFLNPTTDSVILKFKDQAGFDSTNDWYQLGSTVTTAYSNDGVADLNPKLRCYRMDRQFNYYSCYLQVNSVVSKTIPELEVKELPLTVSYYNYYSLSGSDTAFHEFNISFPCAAVAEPVLAVPPIIEEPADTSTPPVTEAPKPATCPIPSKSINEVKSKVAQKFYRDLFGK